MIEVHKIEPGAKKGGERENLSFTQNTTTPWVHTMKLLSSGFLKDKR